MSAEIPYGDVDDFPGQGFGDDKPDLSSPIGRVDTCQLNDVISSNCMPGSGEEIMQHIGRAILCWLRGTKVQTYYPKSFYMVGPKAS